jgi:DNA-binding transcriptional MerR regulator
VSEVALWLLGIVVAGLLVPSALGMAPWLARRLVRRRVRRLPSPYRERYEEEWTAELNAMGDSAGIGAPIFAVVSGLKAKEMATIAHQMATNAADESAEDDRLRLRRDAKSVIQVLETGYRGSTVCKLIGISHRQLDYWARTRLVTPSVRMTRTQGSQRLYSFENLVELRIIKRLLDAGVSLQRIREAIRYLRREAAGRPLTDLTLMSDGQRIYAARSGGEVIDVLSHGQAVFGIAIGRAWSDTENDIAHLPAKEETKKENDDTQGND